MTRAKQKRAADGEASVRERVQVGLILRSVQNVAAFPDELGEPT